MANSQYILTITKNEHSYRFKLTYKKGLFLRFERDLAAVKNLSIWDKLLFLVPRYETEIDQLAAKQYKSLTVTYQKVVKQSKITLYGSFMGAYLDFYSSQTNIDPIINVVAGAALKQIITNLKKLTATEADAIDTWRTILSNWKKLEPFYRNQLELKQINSNLNTILRQVKNGQNAKHKAASAADAARENL